MITIFDYRVDFQDFAPGQDKYDEGERQRPRNDLDKEMRRRRKR